MEIEEIFYANLTQYKGNLTKLVAVYIISHSIIYKRSCLMDIMGHNFMIYKKCD